MNIIPYRSVIKARLSIQRGMKTYKINNFIDYIHGNSEEIARKPIVILFSWLAAKPKHFLGLYDYYLGRDFDIVKVQVHPWMLLRPVHITPVLKRMLDLVSEEEHNEEPLLIHGFSIGGYMFGHTMNEILQNPDKYGICGDRILGHVSDSAPEAIRAAQGVSKSIIKSKVLQTICQKSVQGYIDMCPVTVKKYHMDANRLYMENPLKLPSLYIYSRKDNVARPETIIYSWACQQKRKVPSFIHEFDSPHVQHFKYYPEQYAKLLDDFIEFIKIRNFECSSDHFQKMMI